MRHDIDLIEEVCDKPIVVNSSWTFWRELQRESI